MKKYLLLALSLIIMAPAAQAGEAVTADQLYKQELELTQAALEAKRKTLIAEGLMLTEAESAFWPVYNDYRAKMRKANQKLVQAITDYATAYRSGDISDKQAEKLLRRYMDGLEERIKLKKRYISKFNRAIGKKKTVRFYQLDHRLDLLIQLEVANGVPLME